MTKDELENNQYTPKPQGLEKWLAQTGGINGKPKGLELDALSDDRIREIFVTGVKKHIDPEIYQNMIKEGYIRSKALEAIQPKVEALITSIINQEFNNVIQDDVDMVKLALDGYDSIPVDELCRDTRDNEIYALAESYFK
ncbi:MAG: hypothetical protein NTU69_11985 [Proteobacteria bacterium]|nr:hypothetical protein [Pseudomonadota bacterium]